MGGTARSGRKVSSKVDLEKNSLLSLIRINEARRVNQRTSLQRIACRLAIGRPNLCRFLLAETDRQRRLSIGTAKMLASEKAESVQLDAKKVPAAYQNQGLTTLSSMSLIFSCAASHSSF
jgi:hypothetical protein